MGENFTLLWSESLRHTVFNVAVSSDGNTIVASSGRSFSVFDRDGSLLWTEDTYGDCLAVSVSRDGQLIVVSSSFGGVALYDRETKYWKHLIRERAPSVSLASDGSCVAVALTSMDVVILMSTNGQGQLWKMPVPEPTVVATNADGSYVAVGTARGGVLLYGSRGELVDSFVAEGCMYGLAMDSTASYLAAAASDKPVLYFFSRNGAPGWSKPLTTSSLRVAMSGGGEVVACADLHYARLIARDGSELMTSNFTERLYGVALTADGSLLFVGGSEGLKCLKTSLRSEDSALASQNISPRLISEIRSSYLNFAPEGLCRWFVEFDKATGDGRYAACDALLEEIDSGGYELDATEAEYVTSRRGALALSRGITHELKKEFDEADRYYRSALEYHVSCKNREGEGQVRALLERGGDQSQRESLARQFREKLRVLGSGEGCLTHRVGDASAADLLQLINTAKETGHLEPLLTAIDGKAENDFSVANAAAALVHLQPGPGISDLLRLIHHPSWFVRWRAWSLIARFVSTSGQTAEIEPALAVALHEERDPAVRCELLQLVINYVGNVVTDDLVMCLRDWDPDVKFLACQALAKFGTRRELAALDEVQDGKAFYGDSVAGAAYAATTAINQRQPKLEAGDAFLYSRHTEKVEPSELFSANELLIQGMIQVSNVDEHTYIYLEKQAVDGAFFFLNFHSGYYSDPDPEGEVDYLLIDWNYETGDRFMFNLERPFEGWRPGQNSVYVYFDGVFIKSVYFEIVTSVALTQPCLSATLNSAGLVINPSNVFAANTARMYCQVVVDKAAAGTNLELSILDRHGNLLRKDQTVTESEARQSVLFQWLANDFTPGTYTVLVEAEELGEVLSDFEVIDAVKITDACLYSYVDWNRTAALPVSDYQPHDDFVLAAKVLAPVRTTFSAELHWNNQPVFKSPANCLARSSDERVATFVFRKPDAEWPTGDYEITIYADKTLTHTIPFEVKPVPLSQKISTLATHAREFVRYEGKAIGKSVIGWGIKLPSIAMVLFLMNALLTKVAGEGVASSAWVLNIASWIGASSLIWWIGLGVVFGVVRGIRKDYSSDRVHGWPELVLLFVYQGLLGQQMAYLVFAIGYLWPNGAGQLFSKILFAAPIVAWITVISGGRFFVRTYMADRVSWTFATESLVTFFLSLGLYWIGLFYGLLLGLVGAAILWPFGWAASGWSIGVHAGFVIGLIAGIIHAASNKDN